MELPYPVNNYNKDVFSRAKALDFTIFLFSYFLTSLFNPEARIALTMP